jgi:hypothetical protein
MNRPACMIIVDWDAEGKDIPCGEPAVECIPSLVGKTGKLWLCAEHYDAIARTIDNIKKGIEDDGIEPAQHG